MDEFWVFGYGSLMWNPGFVSERRSHGRLTGYHRSLCVYSHVYRGTSEKPGLVLGLDRGGYCEGVAFAVSMKRQDDVMQYLRERELVTGVYRELVLPVSLENGPIVPAVTYVVDLAHSQYAGNLDIETSARLTGSAVGQAGSNRDYVNNTLLHLKQMGIEDERLEAIADAVARQGQSMHPTARRF
ncbi:gamma-glutamylcyclotransferase [Martelella sp. HB161492]|uniref:gamma-glutamylcyclotransferase n=1 Tax=Martelella sp. HB161492 TaxID=2720726 RepID=UPI00158FE54B|nr:gamma-glutamylcyclotransferase [Martelella sp. HB161492]